MTTDTLRKAADPRQFWERPDNQGERISQFMVAQEMLYSASQVKWRENYTFFAQTYPVWKTFDGTILKRPYYYPPKSKAIVLQPLKTQFSFNGKYSREPVGDHEKSEEWADDIETWLQNVSFMLGQTSYASPYKELILQLFVYGKSVAAGLRWQAQVEMDEPDKDEGEDDDQYEARLAAWNSAKENHFPFTA